MDVVEVEVEEEVVLVVVAVSQGPTNMLPPFACRPCSFTERSVSGCLGDVT